MSRSFIELMDDMHLSSQSLFLDYYNAMQTNNISLANQILMDNPELINQITNAGNINYLITGVNEREIEPKDDIDNYLDKLFQDFINAINNTRVVGAFSNSIQYEIGNLVYYQSKGYYAYQKPPIGTLPTNKNYWLEYDIRGFQGYGGVSNLNYVGLWDGSLNYNPGDVVIYQNKMWMANAINTAFPPNLNHYPWDLIMMPAQQRKTPIQKDTPYGYDEGNFWFQVTLGDSVVNTAWQILTPDPVPRFASGSFVLGANIHVVAGEGQNLARTTTHDVFDTLTNTWSQKAPYPEVLDGMGAFSINGKGYCAGGFSDDLQYHKAGYSYDPITNAWTSIASLPESSIFGGVGVTDGTYGYITGGINEGGFLPNLFRYNPTTDTWETISNLPTPRIGCAVNILDNKIYILGGLDQTGVSSSVVEVYDLNTKTWSTLASMINARGYCAGFVNNSDIYVVGGLDKSSYTVANTERYSVNNNTWREVEPMNFARNSLTVRSVGHKGYAIGGINLMQPMVGGFTEVYFLEIPSSFEMIVDTSLGTNVIKIPMTNDGTYDYYIDWGDGTSSSQITTYNDTNATHTYATAGEYTIKLYGSLNRLRFYDNIRTCLKQVTKSTLTYISIDDMFNGCLNLESIPDGIFNNSLNLTSANATFNGCKKLVTVPTDLFKNNSNISSFYNVFRDSGLISIPVGFFDGNNQATTFNSAFKGCYHLASIPSHLFDNCPLVDSFNGTFQNCSKITSLPAALLSNNPEVVTYTVMFAGCKIDKIPTDLLGKACSTATNFSDMFSGNVNSELPEGLFKYAVSATNYSGVFYNCQATTIPNDLFAGNNATWSNAFTLNRITAIGNNSLVGLNITSNMLKNKTALKTVGNDTFWQKDREEITNAPTELLSGCTGLTSIGNINLKPVSVDIDLNSMFLNCSSLTDVSGFFYGKNSEPSLAQNISFESSPLTYTSLTNIKNSLVINSAENKKTLKLGTANLAKLTAVDKLEIINKNWILDGYDVTTDLANIQNVNNLVLAEYGDNNTKVGANMTSGLYYYVKLVTVSEQKEVGTYAVDKTTGLVYQADEIPIQEYSILYGSAKGQETNQIWLSKGENKDEDGNILRKEIQSSPLSDDTTKSVKIGFLPENSSFNLKTIKMDTVRNCLNLFYNKTNLENIEINGFYPEEARQMFYKCSKLVSVNINIDEKVIPVTSMLNMFNGCQKLNSIIGLGNLILPNLTSVNACFRECRNLNNSALSFIETWNMSNVTDAKQMFYICPNITEMFNLTMPKVKNIDSMYDSCGLKEVKGNLIPNTVTYAKDLFAYNEYLTKLPDDLTTIFGSNSNLLNVSGLFQHCSNLTNVDNTPLTVNENAQIIVDETKLNNQILRYCPNVLTVDEMFQSCTGLKKVPIGLLHWNPNVVMANYIFNNCSNMQDAGDYGYSLNEYLFRNTPDLMSIKYAFSNTKINNFSNSAEGSLLGYGGFDNLTRLVDIQGLFSGSAINSEIGNIGLPTNSPNITNIDEVFKNCLGIYSLPFGTEITTNMPKLKSCNSMFSGATNLSGSATPLINALNGLTTLTSHAGAFKNCTNLSDYNSIPSDWK
ncbi:MAG: kelch repeat-containing protein [Candidatus Onthovivens sp.]|nr:kelch repeat-containing protein [Candidatus Onthovivens sp.]